MPVSLPYPEPGIRLIRQEQIASVGDQMKVFQGELAEAVADLQLRYSTLKATAQRRLGRLYNPADYPDSLRGMSDITWDYPSVEPPDYLRQLHLQLYCQECARMQQRFDEAVHLAEHPPRIARGT